MILPTALEGQRLLRRCPASSKYEHEDEHEHDFIDLSLKRSITAKDWDLFRG